MTAPAVLVLTLTADEFRAIVRCEVDAALTAHAPPPSPSTLLDKRRLADVLTVSGATVARMTAEGMPHVFVGASPRYSLDEVRAWLEARGRQKTKAKPSKASIAGVRLLSKRQS